MASFCLGARDATGAKVHQNHHSAPSFILQQNIQKT